ncbi:MAG: NADH:flavin oxidoreductase [Olsenella sp.]|nr:NADH:flavin oxidoreductase [Olsenella sp.]
MTGEIRSMGAAPGGATPEGGVPEGRPAGRPSAGPIAEPAGGPGDGALVARPLVLARPGIVLRDRLVMVPVATAKADAAGGVTDALCAHYVARARGRHLGLVECEHHFVSPEGRANPHQASISRDSDVKGLRHEAAALHGCDTPVLVQLSHAGSAASSALTGERPIAPSERLAPGAKVGHELPRAMDAADIARVVEAFARAARRARLAGFDGVEVHAAHGYLLDQFFSPLTNLREDDYGGDVRGRLRITLEVVDAVRSELSGGMALSVRLGGCDYRPGGNEVADGVEAARLLEAAGVDLLSVSGGMNYYTRIDTKEPGYFSDLSAPVRAAVGVPVILAGGVRRIGDAERLLEDGACDLVGVGRAILNNERWADVQWRRLERARGRASR